MVTAIIAGILLCLLQLLLALPWLYVLNPLAFKAGIRRPQTIGMYLAGVVGAGVALGLFFQAVQDPGRLIAWGRPFGFILHIQLVIALFVAIFAVLTLFWPKGGAVALAAFREGV